MTASLTALLLCGTLAARADAAQPTFTSADGVFQFKHSSSLVRCLEQGHHEGEIGNWLPEDSCSAYNPVCDDAGQRTTLVCFAVLKTPYRDYPELEAAAFSVAEIKSAATGKECSSIPPDWPKSSPNSGRTVKINGETFTEIDTSSAGMNQGVDVLLYRSFHRNKCYELGVRVATLNTGVLDGPVKRLTKNDWKEVDSSLHEAAGSFRFLK